MTTFLWVIVPYVCLAVFVVGHVWRYRYDKFGWPSPARQSDCSWTDSCKLRYDLPCRKARRVAH